jgi:hypothetical protein
MRYLPVAAVAIFAAVSACATPGPSEYHQGAPGTVAPPVRPGHGAPVVGQPGALVRPLPRSPYKRFIPKTTQQGQEDGIWAADGARASDAQEPTEKPWPQVLYGVPFPMPADSATLDEKMPWRQCAQALDAVAPKIATDDMVREALDAKQRACLVSRMFHDCVEVLKDKSARHRDRLEFINAAYDQGLAAAMAEAKRRRAAACNGVEVSSTEDKFVARVTEALQIAVEVLMLKRGLTK